MVNGSDDGAAVAAATAAGQGSRHRQTEKERGKREDRQTKRLAKIPTVRKKKQAYRQRERGKQTDE